MRFCCQLDVRVDADGEDRELLVDLAYISDVLGTVIVVPKGFRTDYASVPRILWSILPPSGKYTKAAVVHDYLCVTKICPRDKADKVFLEAMEDLGVSPVVRHIMYAGVRVGSLL
jgi:hypothetical protein